MSVAVISVHLKIGGHLFRCGPCPGEGEVPWQQIRDPADGVVGDAFEDVVEIEFRVEPVELCRAEQGVDGGGAFSARVRSREEINSCVLMRRRATRVRRRCCRSPYVRRR